MHRYRSSCLHLSQAFLSGDISRTGAGLKETGLRARPTFSRENQIAFQLTGGAARVMAFGSDMQGQIAAARALPPARLVLQRCKSVGKPTVMYSGILELRMPHARRESILTYAPRQTARS